MPIKLNLENRTIVEQAFLDALVEMWKEHWKTLNDEVRLSEPRYRPVVVKQNAQTMGQLRAWVQNKTAFDAQKTQLVTLSYEKFWLLERRGQQWLAGLTRPIVLSDTNNKRWQGPRYTVYVPRNVLMGGTGSRFHFVPEGFELRYARHPHHNARSEYGEIPEHPLDMTPHTCWGDFPTIVTNNTRSGDVVNLFRTFQIYLSRVDMHSLLTHPFEACPFKEIKSEHKGARR